MKQSLPILTVLLVTALFLVIAGCTNAGTSTGNTGSISTNVSGMDTIMPGVYTQFPYLNLTFIDFDITNSGDSDETVRVESEVTGYTEKSVNTVLVPSHSTITVSQNPLLIPAKIPTEETQAQLHYVVSTQDGKVIEEQTEPVTIYAKDTMVWAIDEGNETTDMSAFIGAWVMPHAPGIDSLVRKAADYSVGEAMTGYQCGDSCRSDADWEAYTNAQVKGIYTALKKDYALTYVNSPISFGKSADSTQKVRLPADSLASSSANCIDGTVLYASALESIGINPHIIVLPTHAFVCYDTSDEEDNTLVCLETTMTRSSSFEDAIAMGNEEYQDEINNGDFATGKSVDYSVNELRELGIHPIQ